MQNSIKINENISLFISKHWWLLGSFSLQGLFEDLWSLGVHLLVEKPIARLAPLLPFLFIEMVVLIKGFILFVANITFDVGSQWGLLFFLNLWVGIAKGDCRPPSGSLLVKVLSGILEDCMTLSWLQYGLSSSLVSHFHGARWLWLFGKVVWVMVGSLFLAYATHF